MGTARTRSVVPGESQDHHTSGVSESPGSAPGSAPSTRATTPDRDSGLYNKYTELLDIEPHHIEGGVPVFEPSWEQFKDFYLFQKSINKYGMQSGIVKVIPPREWLDKLPEPSPETLSKVRFQKPISQQVSGTNGQFMIQNLERQKNYNLIQWKKLSMESNFQLPVPRGEKRERPEISEEERKIYENTKRVNLSAAEFEGFPYNIDTSIFTKEKCEFLEQQYWKTLTFSSPFYGADSLGTLFSDDFAPWNVQQLPNLLDYLPEKLPGVNDAYLYGGLWKATFSWHTEDQDLYSINYLHFGAPKQWYSIPQRQHEDFYRAMAAAFPEDHRNCSEFLRHKTFLVSPAFLEKHGITPNKIIHREKEFIITYPFGYHSGFNYGYNLAESVNFALEEWLDIGVVTKKCECVADSVGIDMAKLIKRLNGDDSEEEEEEEVSEEPEESKPEVKSKPKGKQLPKSTEPAETQPQPLLKPISAQCVLCPNKLSKKLLRLRAFELLEVADYSRLKKKFYAHRLCAECIPELKIVKRKDYTDTEDDDEIVCQFPEVPPARRRLKCCVCRLENPHKTGACFQCGLGKCTKAFHATCAFGSGLLISRPSEETADHRCKQHRPKTSSFEPHYVGQYLKSLSPGNYVQFALNGNWLAGEVIRNNHTEESVDVFVFCSKATEKLEVMYDCILIPPEGSISVSASDISLREQREQEKLLEELGKNKLKHQAELEARRERKRLAKLEKPDLGVSEVKAPWVTKTQEDNYITEVSTYREVALDRMVPDTESSRFWYYKHGDSTDQVARYSDNPESEVPNDAVFLRWLEKKKLEVERKKRKAEREARKALAAKKVKVEPHDDPPTVGALPPMSTFIHIPFKP